MKNPYELRFECFELAQRIQNERFQNEKDRFFKGLIPDYPEYPSTESWFELADSFIKKMSEKGSYKKSPKI